MIAWFCLGTRGRLRLFWFVKNSLPILLLTLKVRRRSLVVLKDECYSTLLHGIQEVREDKMDSSIVNLTEDEKKSMVMPRSTRVSLTIRHVPKTSKLKIRL